MSNRKFMDKIIKKDPNNELELVLENKAFDELSKNMLLSILYKIEASYNDYKIVKRKSKTKEEFIKKFIDIIKNECDDIKLINDQKSKIGNKTFVVEKEKKKITCYPIEKRLLYCLAKIDKKDKIIQDQYDIICETMSELINTGNSIEIAEIIRDFNGWSWFVSTSEIESIEHNLIYFNLIMLVGDEFLEKWIWKKEEIDYYKEFLNILKEKYGNNNKNQLQEELEKLSILLKVQLDPKYKQKISKDSKNLKKQFELIKDKDQFINEIDKTKRKLTRKIKKIDKLLNDKILLQDAYEKEKDKIDDEKFNLKKYKEMLKEERIKSLKNIEKCNKDLLPQNYIKIKSIIEQKLNYIKIAEIEDIQEEIKATLIELQKLVMKCCKVKIEKTDEKNDIIDIIYLFRYYCMIPLNINKKIGEEENLLKDIENLSNSIIKVAIEKKILKNISKKLETNYQILKQIFEMKIIKLENIEIKMNKEDKKIKVQYLDSNLFEKEIYMPLNLTEELNIKLNKKEKIFQ